MSDAPGKRRALVTGAGGTLGRAVALELTRRGRWHVLAADIDLSAAAATVAAVVDAGGCGTAVALDVRDPDAWQTLIDQLRGQGPALDLLVNAAGVCAAGEVAAMRLAAWQTVVDVNYYGVLHGCQTVVPWMQQQGHGAVLNVASISGLVPLPSMAAYASAKAAVVALSEALHAELRPSGISVTVAAPGFFPSGLIPRGDFADEKLGEMAEELSQQTPLRAEQVAREALDAVARRRLYSVAGRRARRFWLLKRLAPAWLTRQIAVRYHRWRNDA